MRFLEIIAAGPYNAAFAVALITGLTLAVRAGRADGYPRLAWAVLLAAGVTIGLTGSKFIIFDFHPVAFGEKSNLGGIVAGVAAVLVVARALGLGAKRSLDTLTIPALTAMAIGRVGCFLAGCCKGTLTSLPWGVQYDGDPHAVHPVQLYEAGADLLLVAALMRLAPRREPGYRFGIAVAGYATIRFFAEFLRAGRESIGGLNPVQWSVLVIGATVALWTAWQVRHGAASARTDQHHHAIPDEARAFGAAIVVASLLVALTFVFTAWFTPLERTTLVVASAVLLGYAVVLRFSRATAMRFAPSLSVLLLFQQPQKPQSDDGPRREIVVGGSIWRGAYERVVGHGPAYWDDCTGSMQEGMPVWESREYGAQTVSVGVRQRLRSGTRVTVEGQLVTGRDRVTRNSTTDVTALPTSVGILGGGARTTIEGARAVFQLRVLGGTLSKQGDAASGPAVSLMLQLGAASGFFVEGRYADPKWFSTLGELSYAGIGYTFVPRGPRLVLGAGNGYYVGLHVPIRGFEFDVAQRGPSSLPGDLRVNGGWTVGLKHGFPIR